MIRHFRYFYHIYNQRLETVYFRTKKGQIFVDQYNFLIKNKKLMKFLFKKTAYLLLQS